MPTRESSTAWIQGAAGYKRFVMGSISLCLLLFVAASAAMAQTTSTEIVGTVTGSTAAVAPNARVTLLRPSTGERGETRTTEALGEAGRLQFRAEFSNLTNTPQFGQPGGIGRASLDSELYLYFSGKP